MTTTQNTKDNTPPFTSSLSTAQRVPTTTFETILPPGKLTTWEIEDTKMPKKRHSAELAAKAKAKVGATVKSAVSRAEGLKRVVEKSRVKGDTQRVIRAEEKAAKG